LRRSAHNYTLANVPRAAQKRRWLFLKISAARSRPMAFRCGVEMR